MSIFFGPGSIGVSRSDPDALPAHSRSSTARRKPHHETSDQPGAPALLIDGDSDDIGGVKVEGVYIHPNGERVNTVYRERDTVNSKTTTHAMGKPVDMFGFTLFARYLNSDLYSSDQVSEANGGLSLSEAIRSGRDNIVIPCPVKRFHRYVPKKPIEFFFSQPKPSAEDIQTKEARSAYLAKIFSHGPNRNEWQQEINLRDVFTDAISKGTNNIIPYAIQLNIKSFESNFHVECFIEAHSYAKLPPPGSSSGDTVYTGLSDTDQHMQSWVDIGGYSPAETRGGVGNTDKVREMHIPLTNRHASSVTAFIAPDSYNDALFTRWISIPIESLHSYLKQCPTIELSVQVKKRGERMIKCYQFDVLNDITDANNFCQWLYAENRTNLLRQMESHGVSADDIKEFNGTMRDDTRDNIEYMPVPAVLFDYLIAGFAERFNLNNIVMPLDKLRVVIRPLHSQDLPNELNKAVPIIPSFTLGVQVAYDLYKVKGVSDGKSPGEIGEQLRARGIAMRHFLDIAAAGQPTNIFMPNDNSSYIRLDHKNN